MSELTQVDLQKLVRYEPDTGRFVRLVSTSANARAGDVAGSVRKFGYIEFRVGGKLQKAHRLAWLYMTGKWPEADIDHMDGNPSNNRWTNLREASNHTNLQNLRCAMRSNKSTGLLGASYDKMSGKFKAQITTGGRNCHIGLYATAEEAHAAYVAAKRRLHPGCTI